MKVLAALALVQIVGFLSNAIAQESIPERNAHFTLINQFRNAIGSVNITAVKSRYLNVSELEKIKCRKNGGPNAYDTAVESLHIYFDSTIDLINTTQIQLEAALDEPHGLSSAIEMSCHSIMSMTDLKLTLINSFKPCWIPAERDTVELINNVSISMLQYICQKKGARISEFINADGIRCVQSTIQSAQAVRCTELNSTRNALQLVGISYPRELEFPWSVPIVSLNTEYCIDFENFQRCIVAELRKCEYSTPSDGINALFDIVKESLGCTRVLRAQTSPATNIN